MINNIINLNNFVKLDFKNSPQIKKNLQFEMFTKTSSIAEKAHLFVKNCEKKTHQSAIKVFYKTFRSAIQRHSSEIANIKNILKDHRTLLIKRALKKGDVAVIKALVQFPADHLFVFEAVQEKHLELVQFFIENGVDIEIKNKQGHTLLMKACKLGLIEICKYLLEQKANVNTESYRKNTAIFSALKSPDIVRLLVTYNADIHHMNQYGMSVLHVAARNGNIKSLAYLIDQGVNVNAVDEEGNTPLLEACLHQQTAIIEYLITHVPDININAQNRINKDNACIVASDTKQAAVVDMLLKHPQIDVNLQDHYGETALMKACRNGDLKTVEQLLKHQANPHFQSKSTGRSRAIDFALIQQKIEEPSPDKKFTEIIQMLLPFEKHPLIPFFIEDEKLLCHRFGIDLCFKNEHQSFISMLGMDRLEGFYHLNESLKQFIDHPNKLEDFNWAQVKLILAQTLKNSQDPASMFNSNDSFDILSFEAGWQAHATTIVVSKSKNILIKCNRGETTKGHGLEVFEIKKPEHLQKAFEMLCANQNTLKGKEIFQKEIDDLLKLKLLFISPHKPQKVGNCGWASAKLNVRAVIYLLLLDELPNEQSVARSYKLYKQWTHFDRLSALEKLIEKAKQIDQLHFPEETLQTEGLIHNQIFEEIYKKSQPKSLFPVLIQQYFDNKHSFKSHYPLCKRRKINSQPFSK